MKITKLIVEDDNGNENIFNVIDGTVLLLCEGDKVLSQVCGNDEINMKLLRKILKEQQIIQE